MGKKCFNWWLYLAGMTLVISSIGSVHAQSGGTANRDVYNGPLSKTRDSIISSGSCSANKGESLVIEFNTDKKDIHCYYYKGSIIAGDRPQVLRIDSLRDNRSFERIVVNGVGLTDLNICIKGFDTDHWRGGIYGGKVTKRAKYDSLYPVGKWMKSAAIKVAKMKSIDDVMDCSGI